MKRMLCAMLAAAILAGCANTTNKSASELADEVLYVPVEYKNASVPGPEVIVLSGEIKSASATFVQRIGENNLRDFAELELSKANFTVLERADSQQFFDEIGLAANLGDAEALRVFKKGRFKSTKWFLAFDILKAEPVASVHKSADGTAAGIVTGVLVGALVDENAGVMVGTTIASAKSAQSSSIWNVGLRYKIMNAVTGEQVASNYFEDKMEVRMDMNSFLGATKQQSTSRSLDTMVQRLVQKAVQEIDTFKGDPSKQVVLPEEKTQPKSDPKKELAVIENYKAKAEAGRKKKDGEAALLTLQGVFQSYANIEKAAVMNSSCAAIHENILKEYAVLFALPEKMPKWREYLRIDVSGVQYELREQEASTCKIKLDGEVVVHEGKKPPKHVSQTEVYTMTKDGGQWKVCSFYSKQ